MKMAHYYFVNKQQIILNSLIFQFMDQKSYKFYGYSLYEAKAGFYSIGMHKLLNFLQYKYQNLFLIQIIQKEQLEFYGEIRIKINLKKGDHNNLRKDAFYRKATRQND